MSPRPSTRRICLWLFVWPVAAFCVFAGLQAWRIAVYDAIQRDLRPGSRTTVSPPVVSELGSWVLAASSLQAKQRENPFQVLNDVWRVPNQRPVFVVRLLGSGAAMAVVGWAVACGLLTILTLVIRWIPTRASLTLRGRIAMYALQSAWPWGLAVAALTGGASWFLGFDRDGWTQPLIDGLAPTSVQVAGVCAAWAVLMALISLAFLRPAAAAAGMLDICPRCAYPRAGLAGVQCPECAMRLPEIAAMEAATDRTVKSRHRIVLKAGTTALTVLAAALSIVLILGPGIRGWARLRPAIASWRHLATLESGAPVQSVQSIYGTVTLAAENRSGWWAVQWQFEPFPARGMAASSGTLMVLEKASTPEEPAFAYRPLPFGTLCVGRRPTDPGLVVQGSGLIFR